MEISIKYVVYMQFMAATALLRNIVYIEVRLAATTLVK